ncbi:MAG: Tryptophan synthase beta chain, partial [uncultured Chloroflexia bacterium]
MTHSLHTDSQDIAEASIPQTPPQGRFGAYGGKYLPETLIPAIRELEAAYAEARADAHFLAELDHLQHTYTGRPTPISFA